MSGLTTEREQEIRDEAAARKVHYRPQGFYAEMLRALLAELDTLRTYIRHSSGLSQERAEWFADCLSREYVNRGDQAVSAELNAESPPCPNEGGKQT